MRLAKAKRAWRMYRGSVWVSSVHMVWYRASSLILRGVEMLHWNALQMNSSMHSMVSWRHQSYLFSLESAQVCVVACTTALASVTRLLTEFFSLIGWVCYAEKSHFKIPGGGEGRDEESFLLQHLSRVRSPQQLLAGALKLSLRGKDGISERRPFLVFVMPCYDKKSNAQKSR